MNAIKTLVVICIAICLVNTREIKRYHQDDIEKILEELQRDVEDIMQNEEEIKKKLRDEKEEDSKQLDDLVSMNQKKYNRRIDILKNPAVPKNAPVNDYIWPKGADGVVKIAYTMGDSMKPRIAAEIEKTVVFMNGITCRTGPKWVKRTNEEHYTEFIMDGGCYSLLGYAQQAKQPISIDYGCESQGTIAHEMLHAMGFDHEQSRPDRDNYVEVRLKNVDEGSRSQFEKASRDVWSDRHLKYDYNSIMHYKRKDFSINGKDVIVPAKGSSFRGEFGTPDDRLTDDDKVGLNILYGCKKAPTSKPRSTRTNAPVTDALVTDAPGTDVPNTDGPGTDGPSTDGPSTDAPWTDSPNTDGPGTDGPNTDGPGTDAPWTDAPWTDNPNTNAPGTDAPSTDAPNTDAPWTDAPWTDNPNTNAPGTDSPWTDAPNTDAPGTDVPWTDGPSTDAPWTDSPNTDGPGTDGPGTDAPWTDAPGTDAPWTDGPSTDDPWTDSPNTDAPGTDGPNTDGPGTDGPWTDGPNTDAPGTDSPGTYAPNTAGPRTKTPYGENWKILKKMNKKIDLLLKGVSKIRMKLKKMKGN